MISKLIESLINEEIENGYEDIENVTGYNMAIEDYSKQLKNIESYLPTEKVFIIIDEIECAVNHIKCIESDYFYRQGLKKGIEVSKAIECDYVSCPKESDDTCGRATEAINDHENGATDTLECKEISYMYDLIYKKAFEDGRKQGHAEALS